MGYSINQTYPKTRPISSHPKTLPIMILLLILFPVEISTHRDNFWGQTIIMSLEVSYQRYLKGERYTGYSTQMTMSLISHWPEQTAKTTAGCMEVWEQHVYPEWPCVWPNILLLCKKGMAAFYKVKPTQRFHSYVFTLKKWNMFAQKTVGVSVLQDEEFWRLVNIGECVWHPWTIYLKMVKMVLCVFYHNF